MADKRGRGRPRAAPREVVVIEEEDSDPAPPEPQPERIALRKRWELASVLNFFQVFRELIHGELEFSAEDMETALIAPDNLLMEIHVALLKGIPPVNRHLLHSDAWVTAVCKKISTWWIWVANGENPLEADHGEEINRYKKFDPTTRLFILKALCEIRAIQDDIPRYIADALKDGTKITTFRKERIGGDGEGLAYWYDADPIIGYRLYKEVTTATKQKMKGKGHSSLLAIDSEWETLATNLEEFLEISDHLTSSKLVAEKVVGERIKTDILPVLEQHQKKKEKALKRLQRQALLLDSSLTSNRDGFRQSRRERKPVKYTFDDYDKTIDEAIQISKRSKSTGPPKEKKQGNQPSHRDELKGSMNLDEEIPSEAGDEKYHGQTDADDESDNDYDEQDDYHENSSDHDEEDSDKESVPKKQKNAETAGNEKHAQSKRVAGLRRSRRTAGLSDEYPEAGMKKRLRQRPTSNTDYVNIPSDSEDSGMEADKQDEEAHHSDREASSSATASDEMQDCNDEVASADGGSDGSSNSNDDDEDDDEDGDDDDGSDDDDSDGGNDE